MVHLRKDYFKKLLILNLFFLRLDKIQGIVPKIDIKYLSSINLKKLLKENEYIK